MITLAGTNLFQTGNLVPQLSVAPFGNVSNWVPDARTQAVTNILSQPYPNMQAQVYAKFASGTFGAGAMLSNAMVPRPTHTGRCHFRARTWDSSSRWSPA